MRITIPIITVILLSYFLCGTFYRNLLVLIFKDAMQCATIIMIVETAPKTLNVDGVSLQTLALVETLMVLTQHVKCTHGQVKFLFI